TPIPMRLLRRDHTSDAQQRLCLGGPVAAGTRTVVLVHMTHKRVPSTRVAEWAGHPVAVLHQIYARCSPDKRTARGSASKSLGLSDARRRSGATPGVRLCCVIRLCGQSEVESGEVAGA